MIAELNTLLANMSTEAAFDYLASLYEVNITREIKGFPYPANQPFKVVVILNTETDDLHAQLMDKTSDIFTKTFPERNFLLCMDSFGHNLTENAFLFIHNHSFTTHLKNIRVPTDLANNIFMLSDGFSGDD